MSNPINVNEYFNADGTLKPSASTLSRDDFANLAQQLAQGIAQGDPNSSSLSQAVSSTVAPVLDNSCTLRILQQRLCPFDGRRDVRCLDGFIDSMENYFATAGTLTEASKLSISISYLEKTAATWWKAHIRSTPEDIIGHHHPQRIRSWIAMKTGLLAEFYPTDIIRSARDRLAKIQQTGSVKEYVERFRNIELQIPDLSETEKLDRFRRGLKDNIRLQIALQPGLRNADFGTLVACAVEIDDIIYYSRREKREGFHDQTPRKEDRRRKEPDLVQMDIDTVDFRRKFPSKGSSSTKRVPLTAEERSRLIATKGCFYCRKEHAGHVIKECPSRLVDEAKKVASSSTGSGKH